MWHKIANFILKNRFFVLGVFTLLTVYLGYYAGTKLKMEIEITWDFLYINSDFLGLYANIPLYLLIGIPGLWYAVRLAMRDKEHI